MDTAGLSELTRTVIDRDVPRFGYCIHTVYCVYVTYTLYAYVCIHLRPNGHNRVVIPFVPTLVDWRYLKGSGPRSECNSKVSVILEGYLSH